MMIRLGRPLILLLCVGLALTGCAVTLIAPYDEITDLRLTALHRHVLATLDGLDALYADAAPDYAAVRAELATLHMRNRARPANELTLEQLAAITQAWADLEALHRDGGRLSPAAVDAARTLLDRAIGAAVRLELEKRRAR